MQVIIAIFKNKANVRRNETNLKSTLDCIRKSIESPCLDFTQESLHLRPEFFNRIQVWTI